MCYGTILLSRVVLDRSVGVLKFWSFGVLEYWNIETCDIMIKSIKMRKNHLCLRSCGDTVKRLIKNSIRLFYVNFIRYSISSLAILLISSVSFCKSTTNEFDSYDPLTASKSALTTSSFPSIP